MATMTRKRIFSRFIAQFQNGKGAYAFIIFDMFGLMVLAEFETCQTFMSFVRINVK